MIVSADELRLVKTHKRTAMLIPRDRGDVGELLPCSAAKDKCVRLQLTRFSAGTPVTIDGDPKPVLIEDLTEADGRALGYRTLAQALAGFAETHVLAPDREVFLARFTLGDHEDARDATHEKYLKRKGVGTTTNPMLAMPGEPAVTTEDDLKNARAAAERRALEEEQRWQAAREQARAAIDALRQVGGDSEFVGDLKFLERRLKKMERRRREKEAIRPVAA